MTTFPRLAFALFAALSPLASAQDLLVSSRFTDEVLRYSGVDGSFVGVFADAGLDNPVGLSFGPAGDLYVASADNQAILVYDGSTGAFLRRFAEGAPLVSPRQLGFGPGGNLFVANAGVNEILEYAPDGSFLGVFASGGGLNGPTSFSFGPGGDLYVVSVSSNELLRYDGTSGAFLGVFASAHLNGPHDVAVGPEGLVYVTNAFAGSERIVRFDAQGAFVDAFVSGPGLSFPLGMTWSRHGELFVASQGNDRIKRYDALDGTFVDDFVSAGDGGLDGPLFCALMPERSVLTLALPQPGVAGQTNAFAVLGATPGAEVLVLWGTGPGSSPFAGCPGGTLDLLAPRPLGRAFADESGNALFLRDVPPALAGQSLPFQALAPGGCETSPVLVTSF